MLERRQLVIRRHVASRLQRWGELESHIEVSNAKSRTYMDRVLISQTQVREQD